jgi:peptidoglycan DL-endopeptidase CwlO
VRGKRSIIVLGLGFLLVFGCAPKKVRVYESVSEIRSTVMRTAVNLLGKPYRNGAKGPDSFDCSGLVHFVYKKAEVTLPVSTDPLIKAGYEIPRENILPGDLVFFKVSGDFHVGILVNRNQFIHSSKSKGVAVDELNGSYWRTKFLMFRSVL